MKKLVLFAVIAATMGATACKKDKTCSCTYGSKVSATTKTAADAAAKVADKNSTLCSAVNTAFSTGTADSTKVTCSLK